MNLKKLTTILLIYFFSFSLQADEIIKKENKNTEFNVFTGMFDFSDDGKRFGRILGIRV